MDRYVVVGNPIEHSQSPMIHAEFARATGQAMEYGRLLAPLDALAPTLRQFAADGGRGCNITVPFKFEACALAPRRTERATLAEAANTLCLDGTDWLADNTDGAGLVTDIEANAGVSLRDSSVLLIGAGGAAAGALGPLLGARPAQLVIANRNAERAFALVQRHAALATTCGVALRGAGLDGCGAAFDIVINASASSLQGAAVPVPPVVLRPGTLALDMMYGPASRPFLDWAQAHGAQGRDGLGMLVEQAAESFAIWRGVRPDTAPVLQSLRQRMAGNRP